MTTFEITIIVLLAAIVVLLIVLLKIAIEGFRGVWQNQNAGVEQLCGIEVNTHHASSVLQDHIAPDVESISNNFLYLLDESKGLPFKIDWDKLSKEQQDEFLKRLILPNYDKPIQPIYTPCYAPDGICMNPHGDCINCPKRGTGGTWSTTLKAEGEMFQEMFNNNKED